MWQKIMWQLLKLWWLARGVKKNKDLSEEPLPFLGIRFWEGECFRIGEAERMSLVICTFSGTVFLFVGMYLPVPPLTKASSLEDEGIVLKVEEREEQKKEIKKEGGVEHHDTKEEKQLEQFNEPSTSSGSACPEVNVPSALTCTSSCCWQSKWGPPHSVPAQGRVSVCSMFLCSHWPFRPDLSVSVEHSVSCGAGLSRGVMPVCRWDTSVPSSQPPGQYTEVTSVCSNTWCNCTWMMVQLWVLKYLQLLQKIYTEISHGNCWNHIRILMWMVI